jgi:hypothetical protein
MNVESLFYTVLTFHRKRELLLNLTIHFTDVESTWAQNQNLNEQLNA